MTHDDFLTTVPLLSEKFYPKLRRELQKWWQKNRRRFPWRESNDPYHLFVAEFMLQKTQVSKVEQVFSRFIENYPKIEDLALAPPQELRQVFAWLGLVKRAGFIKRSAKIIVRDYGGIIPNHPDDLIKLPGVGGYTANAILCFGYSQAYPVVDTTIARVLKRLLGFQTQKSAWEDRITWEIANKFLDRKKTKEHNYALIDLAATVCLPKVPLCQKCPLQKLCIFANKHKIEVSNSTN